MHLNSIWKKLVYVLQIQTAPISLAERSASIAGGFLGILLILMIDHWALGEEGAALLIASMGASAALLFAAPHGVMSQPWSVFGGHLVSAIVGVTCTQLIPDPIIAAGLAVGIAIGAMQLLGCLHPPGGATALVAVMGGDAVHQLGFQFVLTPVMLNAVTLLAVAFLFNNFFKWRRYPITMMPPLARSKPQDHLPYKDISHADFVAALSEVDTFIDITEQDLLRIYDLVTRHEQNSRNNEPHD